MEKRDIIPDNIKDDIDRILEKELFNANRYYAETNLNISKLMEIELNFCPEEFLYRLKSRWAWHNSFYEGLLEPAYLQIFNKKIIEYTKKNIEEIIEIYKSIISIDKATLIMSGAIKKYLAHHVDYLINKYSSSKKNESYNLLMTCYHENFFVQFEREHIEYILLTRISSQRAEKYKKYLMKKYHANDEKIFNGRMKKYSQYFKYSENKLFELLDSLKTSDEFALKQRAFIARNKELLAFNQIVEYDNIDEKFISYNFIGISGFLFRKKILEILNNSLILPNNGDIYEFSDETIVESLEKFAILRSENMEKDVKPLRQKGPTCAIMCLLMILDYYKVIPKINWYDERQYYKRLKSLYIEGTPLSAVAMVLAQSNLETILLHSEKDYFSNKNHYLDDYTYNNSMKEYKMFVDSAKKSGATIKNEELINSDKIKEFLNEDYLIILSGTSGISLHAVLVVGYDKETFCICNPLHKEKQYISKKELDEYMETPIGKWCILVKEKQNEKKQLLSETEKYNEEAKELLTSKKGNERRIKK